MKMDFYVETLPQDMYNLMGAVNPAAREVLEMLDFQPEDFVRFRDSYLNVAGDEILVLTRTGDESEYYHANEKVRDHWCFIDSDPDSFDQTYRVFRYSVPPVYQVRALAMAKEQTQPYPTVKQRLEAALVEMKLLSPSQLEEHPRFGAITKLVKRIASGIKPAKIIDPDM